MVVVGGSESSGCAYEAGCETHGDHNRGARKTALGYEVLGTRASSGKIVCLCRKLLCRVLRVDVIGLLETLEVQWLSPKISRSDKFWI